MSDPSHALGDILDELGNVCRENERVRVGTLVAAFGRRGYDALLLVPALFELSPIGGVPGVPTVLALIVGLFAVQILLGRRCMWLPRFLRERTLSAGKLDAVVDKGRPLAARADGFFHGRLEGLTGPFSARVAAAACLALAATVPPLEVVQFASSAPMGAIALFGVALLVHDGLVMLVGFGLAVLSVGVVGTVLL